MITSGSRWVELASGQVRDAELNRMTRVAVRGPRLVMTHEASFLAAYPRIRATALGYDRTGVGVFAVDLATQRYLGAMCLPSRAGGLATGVVGRHSQCPLLLDLDTSIALRQVLCVVEPPSVTAEVREQVRFRMIDLNTDAPPRDEQGRVLASVTAEGPILLQVGGVALYALPTGDPTDWPEHARDAWACLPERVYLDERLSEDAVVRARAPYDPRSTHVTMHRPAARLAASDADDPPVGRLVLTSGGASRSFGIGRRALGRGVLVGRYERCEATASLLEDSGASRVHAMLLEVDGKPWLIDTASTAGLTVVEEGRDAVDLSSEPEVGLVPPETMLRWTGSTG